MKQRCYVYYLIYRKIYGLFSHFFDLWKARKVSTSIYLNEIELLYFFSNLSEVKQWHDDFSSDKR